MLCSTTNDPAGCYAGANASGYNLVHHPTTAIVNYNNGTNGCGTSSTSSTTTSSLSHPHHHHHHHHDYGYPVSRAEAGNGIVNSFVQDLAVAAAAAAALTYHHHPPNSIPSITATATSTASPSVSSSVSGLIYPQAAVKKFWEHPQPPPPPPPGQKSRQTVDSHPHGLPLKSGTNNASTANNSSRNSGLGGLSGLGGPNRQCRSGPSSSTCGSKKRKRVATVAQRRAANIRERRRMFNLNEAFDKLRRKVPTFAYEKRLSRIETLRLAITYISFMDQVIRNEGTTAKQAPAIASSTPNTSTGSIHHPHADANAQDQLDVDYRQPAISPAW